MKKSVWFYLLMILIISCSTDEEVVCSDPAGSVTVNIPNNNFFCFKTGALASNCSFAYSLCCSDILFDPNNFAAATSVYEIDNSNPTILVPIKGSSSIASTGTASKLCDVTSIPTTGYVAVMASDYNIGYVVKLADGTYARFVVKGFGTFTNGGVSSVQINYQYPFSP